MIEDGGPKAFPAASLVALMVPADLNKVIIAAAAKNGVLYNDQLLEWAQMGAECSRLHKPDDAGRQNRK